MNLSLRVFILLITAVPSITLTSGRAANYLAKDSAERATVDNLIAAGIRQRLEADRARLVKEAAERNAANAAERQTLCPKPTTFAIFYDSKKPKSNF